MKTNFINTSMNLHKLFAALLLCSLPFQKLQAHSEIDFIFQPLDQSVSVGADVIFLGTAFSFDPVTYQWRRNGVPIAGQTNDMYYIPSATTVHAGDYDVVVSSDHSSATSVVARVTVDDRFTKIINDPLVNYTGTSTSVAWGDYDNDGDLDAFVTRGGGDFNDLFRNNGGTFEKLNLSPLTTDLAQSMAAAWGDYDNDGWLDLLVGNAGNQGTNFLYKNLGPNGFIRITNNIGASIGNALSVAWGDLNLDGLLDAVIAPLNAGFPPFLPSSGGLYLNTNGGFTAIADSGLTGLQTSPSAMFTDYNNDGWPDLFFAAVPATGFFGSPGHEQLYQNRRTNFFAPIPTQPLVSSAGSTWTASWADYDGDGLLDVYVGNGNGEIKNLFRQTSIGQFSAQEGEYNLELGATESSAWGDYDNDGWIDLLVVNDLGNGNYIFKNRGDGSFTKVEIGSITGDRGSSFGATWIDINNDGFLDLYVANLGGNDYLYRNNRNNNSWISINLAAYRANRSAVGAKVKVLATINGVSRWQMREIASRDSSGSPNSLRAEFGLGNATIIETIRIEWPGGYITEVEDVEVNQHLTLSEPPTISVFAGEVLEGDSGFSELVFPVILRVPATNVVTVEYSTRTSPGISGIPGTDYIATNGTLTFNPGQTTNFISVQVIGNLADQQNRTVLVALSNAVNMPLLQPVAIGTIIDDDPLGVSLDNASVIEGDEGTAQVTVRIWLTKPSTNVVTLDWRTIPNTASAGQDYVTTNGSLAFQPGEMEKFVNVTIIGDRVTEPNEVVFVNILNISGATALRNAGNATILNDDPSPVTINVSRPQIVEGNSGTSQLIFNVELNAPNSTAVTFTYGTQNGTATAGQDFIGRTGSISIPARTTSTNIAITINGDIFPELNETFFLSLSNSVNGVFATNRVEAVIMDDDGGLVLPIASQNGLTFGFNGITNRLHRVEWTPSFSPPEWQPLPGYEAVRGNGGRIEVTDTNQPAGQPHRFYRIIVLP